MSKRKRTFSEWLKIIHNMTMEQYYELNEYAQKALQLEYRGWQYVFTRLNIIGCPVGTAVCIFNNSSLGY